MGKMKDIDLRICEMRESHAAYRRFQDKRGRFVTLNWIFKDKDQWFEEEPWDLGEKLSFSFTQISLQMCLTKAYILWT